MDGVRAQQENDERRWGAYRFRLRATGTVRLLAYEGCQAEVAVPSHIDGLPVTALASNLFRDHAEIERVELPDTVEHAGHHVFDGCRNLRFARLSCALETVDRTLFAGCGQLGEVVLTALCVKLENSSFCDSPVTRVCFGPLVEKLQAKPLPLLRVREIAVDEGNPRFRTDGRALYSKDGGALYRLVVPCERYEVAAGCALVEDRAFDSMACLRHVGLPEGLRRIGRLAFAKTGLAAVHLPASVEDVGAMAFYHCAKLTSVVLPSGLRSIGEEAFALSGLVRAALPASLEQLGFCAFDKTPAQKAVGQGALAIDPGNRHLDLDSWGGLYCHDVFVELIGQAAHYAVRPGTHALGAGSFKRHRTICAVDVPEGVFEVRAEAFKGCRRLVRVDLPRSLERIGERAFLDTALVTLRLSENVREIGDDALLVQGQNQLTPQTPLASIDLDERNPVFYLENGLLCERDGNKAGGDTCLLYVGPDHIVRIPDQVTKIANLAFCGADGVDELYVHDHLQSVCMGAFSTSRTIPRMHVEFPRPVDGYASGDFSVPSLSARYRSPSYLISTDDAGTCFDFEYYDSWVTHAVDVAEFAPAGLYRLTHPMSLDQRTKGLYEGIFARRSTSVCRFFAERGDLAALEALCERGLLPDDVVGQELEAAVHEGRAQATGCLLELRHRRLPADGIDFSL